MEKLKVQIQNDKIFAPIKDKWLIYKPEEEVRQKYICRLVNNYGYSLDQMEQELKVTNSQRGQGAARADIVVWKTSKDKTENNNAFIIVECKAQNVTIKTEDYYQGYNYASWAGADFFVTTNQKETRVFRVNKGKLPKALEEIAEIPDAKDALDKKKIEQLLTQTKAFTRDEFSRLLFKCHSIIRNNDKLSPEAAFDEISKILFMKIRYERQNSDSQIFSSNEFEKLESAYNSIKSKEGKPFYQNLFDRTKEDFAKDNLFEENEAIKIRENSFKQIVKELEIYNLSTTSDDVKGIAFEQFLGRTFRGELGQFFTPRTIVDFMVEILDPQEGELICDPCCGSGGFLIKAFEYVREKIEQDIEHQKDLLKQQYFDDNYEKLSDSKKKEIEKQVDNQFIALNKHLDINNINGRLRSLSFDCIYGTDANPRMARTAKMNMIMHGDGHGGVHHHDGLLNVNGIWESRFDVIITNPPFGARVNEDLLITESDKFTDSEKIKYYTERYGEEYLKAQSQVNDRIGMPVLYLYNVGRELNCGLTEVLFIERCLNLLKPGGRMGIVLPEGVLNGSNLQKVRDYFESVAKIILIVSLPQEVFLASGATVKTSLVFFKKFTMEERHQYDEIKAQAIKTV
ncbi:MAG: N-6 DNA methylase, partial [Bacteroidales bacterium]|nr:N-6 DNA methylase [Bacteroidales bacterium]